MDKLISYEKAARLVKDGSVVMIGGFMGCGSPHRLIGYIMEAGARDLTVVCNDAGFPDYGCGRLVDGGRVKKLITSHIGLNPTAGKKMHDGSMEIELVPQGTLAERVRCGGTGLGGVLTPTGVGTLVAEGKREIEANGQKYLLELPLRADVALLCGHMVDKMGNVYYRGSTQNFNPLMAMAADTVVVEADTLVEVGDLKQEQVHTPGLFVDYIVTGGGADD